MPKTVLSKIISALVIVILALALNPSGEKHRNAISSAIAERSPIAGALGLGTLASLVVDYHSLGFASYTVSNDRKVSIGAFGYVHVMLDAPEKK
ncbi:MAG: hypothetical protein K2X64_10580 [Rhodocyclaceae bacterium]|nr:hypothetical protein [Rhodocyclaceae bacterium]